MEPNQKLVVVDIGCRWGFAEKFIDEKGAFHAYGFDPDIEECQRLSKRYASSNVSLIPLGLAGIPGKRTLYITQEPACSSLLQPDPELTENYPALQCARHVSTVEVETTTLDHWALRDGVHVVDYIKVDTQGTELEILRGGINTLKNVRCLEVEVEFNPIYLGQPVFADVDMFLREQGFVLWKLTNHVHYSRDGAPMEPLGEDAIFYDDKQRVAHPLFGGQLYWANAHYVRKSVLSAKDVSAIQMQRDISLFTTLGMPDVVSHLNARVDAVCKQ